MGKTNLRSIVAALDSLYMICGKRRLDHISREVAFGLN